MDAMVKMMKANDLRVLNGDADQDLAQLMIGHHQIAIETAEALPKYAKEAKTKDPDQKTIADQKMEMDGLLADKTY